MTPAEHISKARVRLFENGWTQNEYCGSDGSRCLLIALSARSAQTVNIVCRAIQQEFPERVYTRSNIGINIIRFNDHPETEFDDVIRVLDVAEKLAEEG